MPETKEELKTASSPGNPGAFRVCLTSSDYSTSPTAPSSASSSSFSWKEGKSNQKELLATSNHRNPETSNLEKGQRHLPEIGHRLGSANQELCPEKSCPNREKPGGWYASRKAYRSVAYRTWKVGSARKLLSSQHDCSATEESRQCASARPFQSSDREEDSRQRLSSRRKMIPSSASYGPSDGKLLNGTNSYYWCWTGFGPKHGVEPSDRIFAGSAESFWRRCHSSYDSMNPPLSDSADRPISGFRGKKQWGGEDYSTLSDQEGSLTDCFSSEDYCRFQSLKQLGLKEKNVGLRSRHFYSSTTSEDLSDDQDADDDLSDEPSTQRTTSELDESLQSVMENFRQLQTFVTMRPERKNNFKYSVGKLTDSRPRIFHKRSASAGNATLYATTTTPRTPKPKINDGNNNEKAKKHCTHSGGGLAAAKKFLRKLYSNHYTSNSKPARVGKSSTDYKINKKQQRHSIVKQSTSSKIPAAVEGGRTAKSPNKEALLAKLDSSSCSSSASTSAASSPEKPAGKISKFSAISYKPTVGSPNEKFDLTADNTSFLPDKTPLILANGTLRRIEKKELPLSNNFRSWDDAYLHLKQELNNIRARDVLILKRFQRLEQDLRGVKQPQLPGPSPIVELPPNLENEFSLPFSDRLLVNGDSTVL